MNSALSVETATQLAISLVNKPGTLAQVCAALSKAEINIRALTVMETWGEHSVVRTVVSDPSLAQDLFSETTRPNLAVIAEPGVGALRVVSVVEGVCAGAQGD